jgi:uncharacterized membrane protein
MTYQNIDFSKIKPIQLGGGGFLRGAHHPHCDRHNNHVLWVLGHPLCLGCTCMYTGVIAGLAITCIINWSMLSFAEWILLHVLLLIPTVIQPRIQKKWYKVSARFLLGISIPTYFISGLLLLHPLFSIWVFRFTLLIIFVVVFRLLKYTRNRYTYDPCSNCPLGTFPTCDWNLPRLLRENPDVELFGIIREQPDKLIL